MSTTTQDPVSIRLATAAEGPIVADLGCRVFSATFGHTVTEQQLKDYLHEAYSVEAIAKDIADPNKDLIVAVDEKDNVLAFAQIIRGTTEPCLQNVTNLIELQRLYVDINAHGKGLGKRLIKECETMAREQGFRNIWLGVWEHNYKAREIYGKVGYSQVGSHDFDVGGDIQTDDIFLKAL